jgi:hypothetical protein
MASKAGVNDEGLPVVWFGELEEEDALGEIVKRRLYARVGDPPTDERSYTLARRSVQRA